MSASKHKLTAPDDMEDTVQREGNVSDICMSVWVMSRELQGSVPETSFCQLCDQKMSPSGGTLL